jgi:hypothetical protein
MNTEKTLIENENQLSCLGAVSGSIHVTDGRTERYRQFHSASKWFDECEWFQLIDDMNGTLTIKKCMGIEIPKMHKNSHHQGILCAYPKYTWQI